MTIKLEIDGVPFENFISASCEIRLDALSNTFSFELAAAEGEPLPFKGGDPCKVLVDNQIVLTGHIEIIEVVYSGTDHTLFISGRDKTGDLLDSTLDSFEVDSEITLKELIELVLKNINLNIEVIDLVNPDPFKPAETTLSAEIGDNAFEFIEHYARKRQVLLTSDEKGNVVINTNSGESAVGSIQHILNDDGNNVLSSRFSFDTTGRFNVYRFGSQFKPENTSGEISFESIVLQSGQIIDGSIRMGRQLSMLSEVVSSEESCKLRSQWEADIRRARGLIYSCEVDGYRVDPSDEKSDLWRTNKLYQITDDFLGKQQPMLCNSVTYTLDLSVGQQTFLGFVDEKAYTLDLTQEATSEIASDLSSRVQAILEELNGDQ